METPPSLPRASALSLTRASDRLSFLYLDRCRIEQDDNGTHARIVRADGREETTYLPSATLTTLLLGPGTSITQPAAGALARVGSGVVFVGSGAVRAYSAFLSPYAPTTLLEAQAAAVSSDERRLAVATEMYLKRFHDTIRAQFPPDASIEFLRGMEGARVKAQYASLAKRHGLPRWRRNRGNLGDLDPVNEALNYANTALYGVVNAVVLALGLSPGLGVVHRGNRQAFVLDIADLYKAEVTIPLAFDLAQFAGARSRRYAPPAGRLPTAATAPADRRRHLRPPRSLPDGIDTNDWDVDDLHLWSADGSVPAGINYSPQAPA